jgi:hypothetical protein
MATRFQFAVHVIIVSGCLCSLAAAHFDDPNPLSGPKVRDTGVPGESKSFSTTESKLKYENRMISDRVFRETIDFMRGTQVDASLRLTDDQMKAIREQEQKLMAQRREFLSRNKESIGKALAEAGVKNADLSSEKGLRQAMEQVRESAQEMKAKRPQPEGKKEVKGKKKLESDRPSDDRGMMNRDPMEEPAHGTSSDKVVSAGAQAAALQQLADIRRNFPKSDDQHAAVWAILTAPQRDVAEAKLKELMSQESEQRMLPGVKNQVERRLKNGKFEQKGEKKAKVKSSEKSKENK